MDKIITKRDFTVLLPIYQRSDLIENFEKVLESIYQNTIKPNELIVLIDGAVSNDFKEKIKREEAKYKYKILWSDKIGLAKILNKGIKKVKATWIARMDGDDICAPDRFEKSIDLINQGFDLFGGQIIEKEKNTKNFVLKRVPVKSEDIKKMLKYRNPFNHMTVFYKTELAKKIGGYPDLYLKEDYGFWCKMIGCGAKVANMPYVVVEAKTGNNFFMRRGGLKYIQSEFYLQKIMLEQKLTNLFFATIIFILKSIIYILPLFIKKFIYKTILRK